MGQSVTLTATVTVAAPNTGTPNGGTVTFLNGIAKLGTAPLSSGTATLQVSTLPPGTDLLMATYGGNGIFAASNTVIGPSALITTVAGGGTNDSGDGGPATAAVLGDPSNVAVDAAGDLFIAEPLNHVVREVHHATGVITTVAGNGTMGGSGAGGPATAAELACPGNIAVDAAGDLFIGDWINNVVCEVNHATGLITIVAGGGSQPPGGNVPAIDVKIEGPSGLAIDAAGDLFIADAHDDVVYVVNHASGATNIVAGVGYPGTWGIGGYAGDGGPATAAVLNGPSDVAVDAAGDVFITDSGNNVVREVSHATGLIATVAGNGTCGYSGDGGPATAAELWAPQGVAVDAAGDLFITDGSGRVREVDHATGLITTVAGNGTYGYSGDGGQATTAELGGPAGIAVDAAGDLFIADGYNNRIRAVNHATGVIATVAGNGPLGCGGDGGPATAAGPVSATGVAVDDAGDIFIADLFSDQIREVNHATGTITTIAGNGYVGYSGDGGPATAAELDDPMDIAVDAAGDLFLADGDRVREVNHATGMITTATGNGTKGYSGDGGQATAAELSQLSGEGSGIAVDSAGDLFVADGNRIRVVNHATGVITTVAGDGIFGYSGDGGPAIAAELDGPGGIAVDAAGDLFIVELDGCRVQEVNQATGLITTVAGNGIQGDSGDGGLATAAELDPQAVAVDATGDLFIVEANGSRVREVNLATGVITTVAGNGTAGYGGDNGPATAAELSFPIGVAVDSAGDLFIADTFNGRVREVASGVTVTVLSAVPTATSLRVSAATVTVGQSVTLTATVTAAPPLIDTPDSGSVTFMDGTTPLGSAAINSSGIATLQVMLPPGTNVLTAGYSGSGIFQASSGVGPNSIITTVAGGSITDSGDGGPATAANLSGARGVAVDAAGNTFIADPGDNVILEVKRATGLITTVAGNGTQGYGGDDGPATAAQLSDPMDVAVGSTGDLFIADTGNGLIREVNLSTGIITTVAGGGSNGLGDNGPATAAQLSDPESVAVDSAGDLFIADTFGSRVREVILSTGTITTVAGRGAGVYDGDNGPAAAADLAFPCSVAVDDAGNIFIAESGDNRVREINHATGVIATVAGNGTGGYSGDGGPATAAQLWDPAALAVDSAGDLFIADSDNARIREVHLSTGVITTVAGGGDLGLGDNGPATAAELDGPSGVAVDTAGDLVIADYGHNRIREVNQGSGAIVTIAGNGSGGGGGDNGPATAAALNDPFGVAVDSAGDLFIADALDNCIREVSHATGAITTVAGGGNQGLGDGGQATAAELDQPWGVAVDSAGELFIADGSDNRVREVNLSTGVITTVAGDGAQGYSGDNGPATAAQLDWPTSVTVDSAGDLFIADTLNDAVREVNLSTGVITTVAGDGHRGYSGDGGPAAAAELASPLGIAVDSAGDLFIADNGNGRIREVDLSTGEITTIAGGGSEGLGDDGPATAVQLNSPFGVALDAAGDLFVASSGGIREVNLSTGVITTVAGNGTAGYGGDNGPATAAEFRFPIGVAVDSAGDLFIADTFNGRIREVASGVTVTVTAAAPGLASFLGVFDPAASAFFLKDSCCPGPADATVCYGPAGSNWKPLAGDWNGDGPATLGLYNPATGIFYLRETNSDGPADLTFQFGPGGQGWLPIAGDWDGNGTTTVGLYDPATGTFFLKNSNSAGPADLTFNYGPGGDLGWLPVVGDWDGKGTTTVGLYDPATGTFFLKDTNSAGPADSTFNYGPGRNPGIGVGDLGWLPLAGDWDGKGTTTVGLYSPGTGTFFLKDTNSAGPADMTFNYGPGGLGWTPLVGDWICPEGERLRAVRSTGATPALANAGATGLTATALEPVVGAAIARWAAAGASSATLARMASTQIVVGDLPGGELAQESSGQIIIDRAAAGDGWLVGPTAGDDHEFAAETSNSQPQALDPRAVDRMDLLTVVEHELGIVAGLEDLDPSSTDLMSVQLATDTRRVPTTADVDAIFAADGVS
jgi:hypothetical protein